MNQTVRFVLITFIAFLLYFLLNKWYFRPIYQYLNELTSLKAFSYFTTYLLVGMPIFIGILFLHPAKEFFSSLGIHTGFFQGLITSFIFSLPMLIGYALVFQFNEDITWLNIFTGAICAALFEEIYFRGMLFGQLYRFTRLGFIPAIIVGALLFASGHLYQSQDLGTLFGIFLTTFSGALFFAWLYVEWRHNLWIPIFLHLFMNLHWMLFSASDNAFGNTWANVFRVITIGLTVIGTIQYKKRTDLGLDINRKTLWIKPSASV